MSNFTEDNEYALYERLNSLHLGPLTDWEREFVNDILAWYEKRWWDPRTGDWRPSGSVRGAVFSAKQNATIKEILERHE